VLTIRERFQDEMSAPPPLAVPPRLRTLGQQLTLLFALLTLSVGAYALYIGLEQADFIEHLERRHADELTQHLARPSNPLARRRHPRAAHLLN
jgi:hypothetical protein